MLNYCLHFFQVQLEEVSIYINKIDNDGSHSYIGSDSNKISGQQVSSDGNQAPRDGNQISSESNQISGNQISSSNQIFGDGSHLSIDGNEIFSDDNPISTNNQKKVRRTAHVTKSYVGKARTGNGMEYPPDAENSARLSHCIPPAAAGAAMLQKLRKKRKFVVF